jgi:hypothetical protein
MVRSRCPARTGLTNRLTPRLSESLRYSFWTHSRLRYASGARGKISAEVFERELQAAAKADGRLPLEDRSCPGNIGTPLRGIVLRKRFVANPAAGPGDEENFTGAPQNVPLFRVADVDGKMFLGAGKAENAVDQIGDVAETARLAAVAIDREVLFEECLHHEVRDDPAVSGLQPRAVGIEDPHHPCVDAVVSMISHDESFGESLGLVINRPRTDWVDAPPIGFRLRMNVGVAVTL